MKLAEIQTTNIRAGVLDEAKFTLDATGPVFQTIISGLYTNKKQAPLREYGANAFDASKNFDLHLPSVVDPRVVIRDYGPGLSHEDVMHKFTKLGGDIRRRQLKGSGPLAPYRGAWRVTRRRQAASHPGRPPIPRRPPIRH